MFVHVFAQTTHVVAAPHGFACVGIPLTRLYILSVIEIRSGVSELQGVKIWPFPLLWLFAFTTACTTIQAVMDVLSAIISSSNKKIVYGRTAFHFRPANSHIKKSCDRREVLPDYLHSGNRLADFQFNFSFQ